MTPVEIGYCRPESGRAADPRRARQSPPEPEPEPEPMNCENCRRAMPDEGSFYCSDECFTEACYEEAGAAVANGWRSGDPLAPEYY